MVWKYVFIYTAIVVVAGFVLTLLWHQWRYKVRGRRRSAACAVRMETVSEFQAVADRQARKSNEWFVTQTAAIADIRRELRSAKA